MKTVTVDLTYGVSFDGKQHKQVVMRTPTVGDCEEAEKQSEGKGALCTRKWYVALAIVTFGTIPKPNIDVDLLARLTENDWELLNIGIETLKKNGHWLGMQEKLTHEQRLKNLLTIVLLLVKNGFSKTEAEGMGEDEAMDYIDLIAEINNPDKDKPVKKAVRKGASLRHLLPK